MPPCSLRDRRRIAMRRLAGDYRAWLLALVLALAACNSNGGEQPAAAPPIAQPPAPTRSAPATVIARLAQPTTATIPTISPIPSVAPSPTSDPWVQYEPYTIEALRNRTYGTEGQIEIVRVMEETRNFTRYLIAYRSDGLRITGMMNRPTGAGPFPVVILNHGYYPL